LRIVSGLRTPNCTEVILRTSATPSGSALIMTARRTEKKEFKLRIVKFEKREHHHKQSQIQKR
jgi:hypothetical protein